MHIWHLSLQLLPEYKIPVHLAMLANEACLHKSHRIAANKQFVNRTCDHLQRLYTQGLTQGADKNAYLPVFPKKKKKNLMYTSNCPREFSIQLGTGSNPSSHWGNLETSLPFAFWITITKPSCQYLPGRSLYTCLGPQLLWLLLEGWTFKLSTSDNQQCLHSQVLQFLNGCRSSPLWLYTWAQHKGSRQKCLLAVLSLEGTQLHPFHLLSESSCFDYPITKC